MIARRNIVLALGVGALAPLTSFAQQPPNRIYRLGVLENTSVPNASNPNPFRQLFLAEMRKYGYVEGQNFIFERRYAEGKLERLPQLAAELVRSEVDLIMVNGTTTAAAAKNATGTIPIVMVLVSDPVAAGLVSSLARPGGNITGTMLNTGDITAKRLQLLKEAIPAVRRIGGFYAGEARHDPAVEKWLGDNDAAARALGLSFEAVDLGLRPERWDEVFGIARKRKIDAVAIAEGGQYVVHRDRLAEIALKHRMPTIFPIRAQTEAGGLMSYGYNIADLLSRSVSLIDKILRGARPADLPVEQPRTFEFVVNVKTASALGIKFPQSILIRADRVIE